MNLRNCIADLLDQGNVAARLIKESKDGGALHDFRVSVRRLRTLLKFYKAELGKAASKKIRRRLKKVARGTTSARDAEVARDWLDEHKRQFPSATQHRVKILIADFKKQREEEQENLKELAKTFLKVKKKIKERL